MTAVAPAATAVARDKLTEMARTWDARTKPYESLREWTDPDLKPGHAGCVCGKCLVCTWAWFRWDLSLLDGLNREIWAEPRHWSDIADDYAMCADPEGAAREELEMRVASGLDALTGGTR